MLNCNRYHAQGHGVSDNLDQNNEAFFFKKEPNSSQILLKL